MNNPTHFEVGCNMVAEFIDQAEPPVNPVAERAEPVRPRLIGDYIDQTGDAKEIREFTVLLKDGRVLTVRGHNVKQLPPVIDGAVGSYGVVARVADEEVLIAIFQVHDVIGIFHGEMRDDRKIA